MKPLLAVLTSLALSVGSGITAPPEGPPAPKPRFRLVLKAYDGDPAKPATMTFFVDMPDFRHPICFPKLGDSIPHTGLKLESFKQKKRARLNAEPEDVSELILFHAPTKLRFTLPLNKTVEIPVAAPSRNK